MDIVIIGGFSSLRGEERLKLLIEKIKEEFPEKKIIVPNYLEKYAKFKLMSGNKSIPEYAWICVNKIEKEVSTKSLPLIVIGYSLGGIIARYLIERRGLIAKAAILIGTPNRGVRLSFWERLILKILKKPCIEEIKRNSEFLKYLNEDYRKQKPTVKYYLIAGQYDNLVPVDSALGIEAFLKIVINTDHSGLIPTKPTLKPNAIDTIIQILKEEVSQTSLFYFIRQNLNFVDVKPQQLTALIKSKNLSYFRQSEYPFPRSQEIIANEIIGEIGHGVKRLRDP